MERSHIPPLEMDNHFSNNLGRGHVSFQEGYVILCIHHERLTWNLKITQLKRKIIFQTIIFRFHVNLPGCKSTNNRFSPSEFVPPRELLPDLKSPLSPPWGMFRKKGRGFFKCCKVKSKMWYLKIANFRIMTKILRSWHLVKYLISEIWKPFAFIIAPTKKFSGGNTNEDLKDYL